MARLLSLALACAGACADNAPGEGDGPAPGDGAAAGSGAGGAAAPGDYDPADCSAELGGPRVLRRLSHVEYDNTVEQLLELRARGAQGFAADTVVDGFDNNAAALTVTPLLGEQLYAEAERLAGEAVKDLSGLVPCDPAAGDADCARRFVVEFGRRAFRRPLQDSEVERYTALYDLGSADGGFASGIELVLTTLLQSPNLLYRSELGSAQEEGEGAVPHALDAYEVATELSYALTGASPDEALLAAAEAGELNTPEQLQAEAARLLDSERGRAQLVRFVTQWLDVGRLSSVPKDAELFPEFGEPVREAMAGELSRFVTHVAFEDEGTLRALLTQPLMVVDPVLADFYGVPEPEQTDADGFGLLEPPEPERRGVLSLGAVMTTHGRPDSSSPVHRGKLVRERLLCQDLPPPPAGVVVQPPPVDPSLSVRERYAAHSAEQACQGCHRLIDPLGFAFEHFDGVGRYRTMDAGRAVDASGEIVDSQATDGAFEGAAELVARLADSEEVQACFALQWMRFAYGLQEGPELECALEQLQARFADSGGRIEELLLETVATAHFRTRLGEAGSGVIDVDEPEREPPTGEPGGAPTQDSALEVTTRTDSTWAGGQCQSVTVRNNGEETLDWSVQLTIDGTLTDHWNATADADSGEVTFRGADWNRSVAPGQEAQFGYCLSTSG